MIHWHTKHLEESSFGDRLADSVTGYIGSWQFIILSNVFVLLWGIFNAVAIFKWHWDPYPFILLNLVFSWGAWNATPLILMSGNRSAQRDRAQADADYATNIEAKKNIDEHILLTKNQDIEIAKIVSLLEKPPSRLENPPS